MATAGSRSRLSSGRLSPLAQAGLLAGPFLSMVDSNIVNVALPDIAARLHAPLDAAQWIISGYLLALAAGLATSAYLARRFGTLRVYQVSLLGFTVASVACALAPSLGALIATRVLQGLLGAPLVPLAMNVLLGNRETRREFPPAAGVLLFLAPALGPTLGGLLINLAGWPSVFLVNVPFGLLGMLGVGRVPASLAGSGDATARFDPLGMLVLAAGLVLAIYGATQAPQHGWGSSMALPYLATGCLLLLAYTLWALLRPHPAVDLKLLRHPQPALAVALCSVASIVMFAMLVLVPVFMEDLQRTSALVVGLTLLPQGLVTGIGLVVGDGLAARRGARFSALLGLALLTLSTALLLTLTLSTPAWMIALFLSGRGFAVGLTIQPLLTAMLGGLSQRELPDGNTLFNVAERLGGSIGIPLLITFFSAREQARLAEVLRSLGSSATAVRGQLSGQGAGGLAHAVRDRLADAAIAGFHDTLWLLVALSAAACLASLLLRSQRSPEEAPAEPQAVSDVVSV